MKSIFQRIVLVVIGLVGCAGLSGCGDAEVELEEPKFEIGVEFDFHEVEFNYYGRVETPEEEWPRIIPTFSPCYFKIVEQPEWVNINCRSGYVVGDGNWHLIYDWINQLECVRNPSTEPRSGVVKVVVSNVGKDVSRGDIEMDVPVYRFEGEFTVRQEGSADPY